MVLLGIGSHISSRQFLCPFGGCISFFHEDPLTVLILPYGPILLVFTFTYHNCLFILRPKNIFCEHIKGKFMYLRQDLNQFNAKIFSPLNKSPFTIYGSMHHVLYYFLAVCQEYLVIDTFGIIKILPMIICRS